MLRSNHRGGKEVRQGKGLFKTKKENNCFTLPIIRETERQRERETERDPDC
jgi:hypothetical protein